MKRNSVLFGCFVGLLPPMAAHLLTSFTSFSVGTQPFSLYVIAALINLVFVRVFYRNMLERSASGVILITFAAVLVLIFTEKLSIV